MKSVGEMCSYSERWWWRKHSHASIRYDLDFTFLTFCTELPQHCLFSLSLYLSLFEIVNCFLLFLSFLCYCWE